MSERYFYLRKAGRITGPFEAARLLAGARHGRIGTEDEISRDKREWRRVAEVPWLKPESAALCGAGNPDAGTGGAGGSGNPSGRRTGGGFSGFSD